jgi:hypothetical protein
MLLVGILGLEEEGGVGRWGKLNAEKEQLAVRA